MSPVLNKHLFQKQNIEWDLYMKNGIKHKKFFVKNLVMIFPVKKKQRTVITQLRKQIFLANL